MKLQLFRMGAAVSVLEKATEEQKAEITAEIEKMKADGVAEEEIEKVLKEKYAEILAAVEAAPAEAAPTAEGEAVAAIPVVPKKIIIAGAPASGKGTQCEKIREEFKCVHLSTGDMLRAAVAAETEVGLQAKAVMEAGGLVDDAIIIKIIIDRLSEEDCKTQGWLLDGFPRTGAQAAALAEAGIVCDKFVLLDVPDETLVARVTGRRLDPDTGDIYHMEFKPPPDEIKDRLTQRADDTEEKLKPRLENYHTNLAAILDSYADKMFKLDGNRDPAVVWEEIKAELSK